MGLNYIMKAQDILLIQKKLKSVLQNKTAAIEKVENEIRNGRIAGPFKFRPI